MDHDAEGAVPTERFARAHCRCLAIPERPCRPCGARREGKHLVPADPVVPRLRTGRREMAPRVGFEPTTIRLTVECSTAELSGTTLVNPSAVGHRVGRRAFSTGFSKGARGFMQ